MSGQSISAVSSSVVLSATRLPAWGRSIPSCQMRLRAVSSRHLPLMYTGSRLDRQFCRWRSPSRRGQQAKIGDLSDVRLHNSGHLFQICGEQGGKGEEQPMLPPAISERYLIALADLA